MNQQFLIFGITTTGKKFRPSDWADRFCGVLAPIGNDKNVTGTVDHRVNYSPFVYPISYEGDRVVFIDEEIKSIEPLAWEFILSFVKDNSLKMKRIDNKVNTNFNKTNSTITD